MVETLRLAFELDEYRQNGWAMAYWACAGLVALHMVLILAEPGRGASYRRAVAPVYAVMAITLIAVGASVAAGSEAQSEAAGRIGMALAPMIGPASVYFAYAMAGRPRGLYRVFLVAAVPALPLAFATVATSHFVDGAWPTAYGFSPLAGRWTPLLLAQLFGSAWISVVVLWRRYRGTDDPRERRRLGFVIAAILIANVAGIDLSPLFGVRVMPSMFVWLTASVLLMTYALREDRVLGMPDFGWRAVLWLAASSLVIVPVAAVLIVLVDWPGWGRPLPTALVLFLSFVLVRVWFARVQPRLDDLFVRRRRDLREELDRLSDRLLVLHTVDALAREVALLVSRTVYGRVVAFAVADEGEWRIVLAGRPTDDAAALLPVVVRGETIGRLAVGPRPDGRPYDALELEFLHGLAATIAAPLDAARLFEERHRLRISLEEKVTVRTDELARTRSFLESAEGQLVQGEKMATIGLVVAGVASELERAVETVSRFVPALLRGARVYEAAAAGGLLAVAPEARTELDEWARKAKLDFVRRDVGPLVEAIAEGTRRAKSIVSDLSRFARPGRPEGEATDLHAELDSILNLLKRELGSRVTVEKDYAPDLPQVECDPGPIGQVFMNLLINAVQAIEGPGTIRIATRSLPGERVEVAVADTGKGIGADHLPRIFEPFFTTKPFDTRGGTGLGLSISYGIVDRHGGRITVESEAGKGSVFKVTLPLKSV